MSQRSYRTVVGYVVRRARCAGCGADLAPGRVDSAHPWAGGQCDCGQAWTVWLGVRAGGYSAQSLESEGVSPSDVDFLHSER